MIEKLLFLPFALGGVVFVAFVIVTGIVVMFVSHRLLMRCESGGISDELRRLEGNLFRVVGWLLTLLLTLTFTNVVGEAVNTRHSVEREAADILEIDENLRRFGRPATADAPVPSGYGGQMAT